MLVLLVSLETFAEYGIFWFGSLNHVMIGAFYLIFGIISGVLGYLFSFFIRTELESPVPFLFLLDYAQFYNAYATAHGVIMIFFFIMPFLIGGVGNSEIPKDANIKDFCLPRLNNASFWFSFAAMYIILKSFLTEESLGTGWTFYPPLSDVVVHSSLAVTMAIFSIHYLGFSSEGGAINFIETCTYVLSVMLMLVLSLLVWVIEITSLMLLMSLPILACGVTLLLLDREFNAVTFCVLHGGDPVIFQHLFWYFGHPEVYIIILPAFGVISYSIGALTENTVFGFLGMVFAVLSIAVIGFCVWAHHMFTIGSSSETKLYFSCATMIIAVPTSIKIFSWTSSILFSQVITTVTYYWIVGFLIMFLIGGLTGLVMANSALDIVLHDTYYIIGHFHYVLSLGALFGIFVYLSIALFRLFGSDTSDDLFRYMFVLVFCGANILFFPMHFLGLAAQPRRIFCYPDIFGELNELANVGILIITLSLALLMETMFLWDRYAMSSTYHYTWMSEPITRVTLSTSSWYNLSTTKMYFSSEQSLPASSH